MPNGIPSFDTFGRLFALLDPEQFAACFTEWMAAVCQRLGLKQLVIDGKTLHRSFETFDQPDTAEYADCRSWVELDRDLPTEGATPVPEDGAFDDVLRTLGRLLEPTALA